MPSPVELFYISSSQHVDKIDELIFNLIRVKNKGLYMFSFNFSPSINSHGEINNTRKRVGNTHY